MPDLKKYWPSIPQEIHHEPEDMILLMWVTDFLRELQLSMRMVYYEWYTVLFVLWKNVDEVFRSMDYYEEGSEYPRYWKETGKFVPSDT